MRRTGEGEEEEEVDRGGKKEKEQKGGIFVRLSRERKKEREGGREESGS
jgi:hypothetical protein